MGIEWSRIYYYNGSGMTIVNRGIKFDGGKAIDTKVYSSGIMYLMYGASANNTNIFDGQMWLSYGVATNTAISSGGKMYVLDNSKATNTIIYSGGRQIVSSSNTYWKGPSVDCYSTKVCKGARQYVYYGGNAVKTIIFSGGRQYISGGGIASCAIVSSGGMVDVLKGGVFSEGIVAGNQRIFASGLVISAEVKANGVQIVSSGGYASQTKIRSSGGQHIRLGGTAVKTKVFSGGSQIVSSGGNVLSASIAPDGLSYVRNGGVFLEGVVAGVQRVFSGGVVSDAVVKSGGTQVVSANGHASGVKVLTGGVQHVRTGGILHNSVIGAGGSQFVSSGGSALSTTVSSGGSIFVYKGAWTSALTVSAGGSAVLHGGTLSDVSTFSGASISVDSVGVSINAIRANSATKLDFDIRKVVAGSSSAMLIESSKQKLACSFSVTTSIAQKMGTYKLVSNLSIDSSASFTINSDFKNIGTANINGDEFTARGVNYTVIEENNYVIMKCARKEAVLLRGNDRNNNLIGFEHNEIFYGGRGDDRIYGIDGYDVAVYDKGEWGSDIIGATEGKMTLLFVGLERNNVRVAKSGSSMLFAKISDNSQSIVVEGWNSATHNVVFASSMPDFTKWANVATPTETQATAARTEVWKKVGLAQA